MLLTTAGSTFPPVGLSTYCSPCSRALKHSTQASLPSAHCLSAIQLCSSAPFRPWQEQLRGRCSDAREEMGCEHCSWRRVMTEGEAGAASCGRFALGSPMDGSRRQRASLLSAAWPTSEARPKISSSSSRKRPVPWASRLFTMALKPHMQRY